jgi:hypothetical protein
MARAVEGVLRGQPAGLELRTPLVGQLAHAQILHLYAPGQRQVLRRGQRLVAARAQVGHAGTGGMHLLQLQRAVQQRDGLPFQPDVLRLQPQAVTLPHDALDVPGAADGTLHTLAAQRAVGTRLAQQPLERALAPRPPPQAGSQQRQQQRQADQDADGPARDLQRPCLQNTNPAVMCSRNLRGCTP